jgi:hypothetical protein
MAVHFLSSKVRVHGSLEWLCGQCHCLLDAFEHLPLVRICGLT